MARSKTRVELETFQRHAQRMAVKASESPEDRERWRALASEARDHIARDVALEEGLFAAGEVAPNDDTLF